MTDKTTTTTIPDLLPCPMCSGEAHFGRTEYCETTVREQEWSQSVFHHVNCVECGLSNRGIVGHKTREDAAAAWNRRAAPASPPAAQPDYSHLRPEGGRFSFAYSQDTELPWVGWRFDDRDAAHFFRMELDALRNEEIFPAPAQTAQPGATDALTETAKRIAWARHKARNPHHIVGDANTFWVTMNEVDRGAYLSAARASQPQPVGEVVEAVRIAYDRLDTIAAEDGRVGAIADLVRAYDAALRSGEGR